MASRKKHDGNVLPNRDPDFLKGSDEDQEVPEGLGPDETATPAPDDALTEQGQVKDTGPLSQERRVGQHMGKGRPPLMKK